jgi:small-conductance mechanosensitive channel
LAVSSSAGVDRAVFELLKDTIAAAIDEVRRAVRTTIRSAIFMLVAAVLLVIGLMFLMLGIYDSLAAELPAWAAGGIVLILLLLLALVCMLLAARGGRVRRARRGRRGPSADDVRDRSDGRHSSGRRGDSKEDIDLAVAAELGASVWDVLKQRRPRGIEMMVAAFVAGMLLSRRERRRPPDDLPR